MIHYAPAAGGRHLNPYDFVRDALRHIHNHTFPTKGSNIRRMECKVLSLSMQRTLCLSVPCASPGMQYVPVPYGYTFRSEFHISWVGDAAATPVEIAIGTSAKPRGTTHDYLYATQSVKKLLQAQRRLAATELL